MKIFEISGKLTWHGGDNCIGSYACRIVAESVESYEVKKGTK